MLLEVAMNQSDGDWGHGRLENVIEQMNNRQFTPKVRKDLFE